jgi:hypothetical protein
MTTIAGQPRTAPANFQEVLPAYLLRLFISGIELATAAPAPAPHRGCAGHDPGARARQPEAGGRNYPAILAAAASGLAIADDRPRGPRPRHIGGMPWPPCRGPLVPGTGAGDGDPADRPAIPPGRRHPGPGCARAVIVMREA